MKTFLTENRKALEQSLNMFQNDGHIKASSPGRSSMEIPSNISMIFRWTYQVENFILFLYKLKYNKPRSYSMVCI